MGLSVNRGSDANGTKHTILATAHAMGKVNTIASTVMIFLSRFVLWE